MSSFLVALSLPSGHWPLPLGKMEIWRCCPRADTRAPSSGFISGIGRSCSGSDPCAGSYIWTANIIWGIPIVTSILRPLAGASSSSTLTSTPDPDSSDDYPEIVASACGEPTEGGHLICMVALNGDRSNNTSSRHPTIGRSEVSDARTPSGGLVQNLNLDFNAVRV
jgi:hypothetical protein